MFEWLVLRGIYIIIRSLRTPVNETDATVYFNQLSRDTSHWQEEMERYLKEQRP